MARMRVRGFVLDEVRKTWTVRVRDTTSTRYNESICVVRSLAPNVELAIGMDVELDLDPHQVVESGRSGETRFAAFNVRLRTDVPRRYKNWPAIEALPDPRLRYAIAYAKDGDALQFYYARFPECFVPQKVPISRKFKDELTVAKAAEEGKINPKCPLCRHPRFGEIVEKLDAARGALNIRELFRPVRGRHDREDRPR